MRITIAAIGKLKRNPLSSPFEEYANRLRWPLDVLEIDPSRAGSAAARRDEEGMKLERLLPQDATLVALDARGKDLSSEAFAAIIERWQVDGRSRAAFVIGGPDGLAEVLRQRADLVIAFGRATWPHLLVRVMLAEQLFRTESILSNHPYHRGS